MPKRDKDSAVWIDAEYDCGCTVWYNRLLGKYGITYCHKHAAAPEMYEATKDLLDAMDATGIYGQHSYILWKHRDKVDKALALADGEADD